MEAEVLDAPRMAPATNAALDPLLSLRGIVFRPSERTILDHVDFDWNDARVCALVGPNGAGKTVLLRTIHGLLAPHEGEVHFEGRSRPGGDLAFAGQALVFQHPSMFRGSALDNLLVVPGIAARAGERRERALAMLERVGLSDLAHAPALKLSGGERQRLAIARAWLMRPRLLLLDEPTASLDPSSTEHVEQLIREIRADGCRVLLTSHNLGQVSRLADEVVFLHRGRVLERTLVPDFFANPRTHEARQFLQGALPWHLSSPV
ncbi:MAG: ATP-binding cassette domain-containing protein [Burkholderiaceae bacterium]|nr:ATP-binding cassette domain-containing protein [Burkholderiaceae bacterium]